MPRHFICKNECSKENCCNEFNSAAASKNFVQRNANNKVNDSKLGSVLDEGDEQVASLYETDAELAENIEPHQRPQQSPSLIGTWQRAAKRRRLIKTSNNSVQDSTLRCAPLSASFQNVECNSPEEGPIIILTPELKSQDKCNNQSPISTNQLASFPPPVSVTENKSTSSSSRVDSISVLLEHSPSALSPCTRPNTRPSISRQRLRFSELVQRPCVVTEKRQKKSPNVLNALQHPQANFFPTFTYSDVESISSGSTPLIGTSKETRHALLQTKDSSVKRLAKQRSSARDTLVSPRVPSPREGSFDDLCTTIDSFLYQSPGPMKSHPSSNPTAESATKLSLFESFSDLELPGALLSPPPPKKCRRSSFAKENEACPICLMDWPEENAIGKLDSCRHMFCFECIMKWSGVTNKCPLCKKKFHKILKKLRATNGQETKIDEISIEDKDAADTLNAATELFEEYLCEVCNLGNDEEVLLLCDQCDDAYHTYCVGLDGVPEGQWFCNNCAYTLEASSLSPYEIPEIGSRGRSMLRGVLCYYGGANILNRFDSDEDIIFASRRRRGRSHDRSSSRQRVSGSRRRRGHRHVQGRENYSTCRSNESVSSESERANTRRSRLRELSTEKFQIHRIPIHRRRRLRKRCSMISSDSSEDPRETSPKHLRKGKTTTISTSLKDNLSSSVKKSSIEDGNEQGNPNTQLAELLLNNKFDVYDGKASSCSTGSNVAYSAESCDEIKTWSNLKPAPRHFHHTSKLVPADDAPPRSRCLTRMTATISSAAEVSKIESSQARVANVCSHKDEERNIVDLTQKDSFPSRRGRRKSNMYPQIPHRDVKRRLSPSKHNPPPRMDFASRIDSPRRTECAIQPAWLEVAKRAKMKKAK